MATRRPKETFVFHPHDPAADRRRWREHKIATLPEGISLTRSGRAVMIFQRKGQQVVEYAAEISGSPQYDVVVFLPRKGLMWIDLDSLEQSLLTTEEQRLQLQELEQWCADKGIRCSIG